MNHGSHLTRRRFLKGFAAGASLLWLPGGSRVHAGPQMEAGRDSYAGRLCYNENPLGPSPAAYRAMQEAIKDANRYPDWYNANVETVIADLHDLPVNTICAGAGATEIIRLVADAFLEPGDEVITASPTYFQMGADAVRNGASVVNVPVTADFRIDLPAMAQAVTADTRMISLVNPNNPVGTVVDSMDLTDFIHSLPEDVITVVDEAYHHFVLAPEYESCIHHVRSGARVVVIRTFSKAYGLAGARIGYAAAPRELIQQISGPQLFGTVSRSGQAAAVAALKDTDHVDRTVTTNNYAKNILKKGCVDLGLEYIPSETNFMMVDTGTSAAAVTAELAALGFQVRYGWGMPRHIRVSMGMPRDMVAFVAALETVLGTIQPGKWLPEPGTADLRPAPRGGGFDLVFYTDGADPVTLTILDRTGRVIREQLYPRLPAGRHEWRWNGLDHRGRFSARERLTVVFRQGEWAVCRCLNLD